MLLIIILITVYEINDIVMIRRSEEVKVPDCGRWMTMVVGIFWNRGFELKSAVEEREISDY